MENGDSQRFGTSNSRRHIGSDSTTSRREFASPGLLSDRADVDRSHTVQRRYTIPSQRTQEALRAIPRTWTRNHTEG